MLFFETQCTSSHLVPLFEVTPSEFIEKLYGSCN